MSNKLQPGQTVYLEPLSTWLRREGKGLRTTNIKSIGRKYFTVHCLNGDRFEISTLKHDGGSYSSRYKVWLSKEAYELEQETKELQGEVQKYFKSSYGYLPLTNSQLKRIKAIIEEPVNK